jgi:hypothetical protein
MRTILARHGSDHQRGFGKKWPYSRKVRQRTRRQPITRTANCVALGLTEADVDSAAPLQRGGPRSILGDSVVRVTRGTGPKPARPRWRGRIWCSRNRSPLEMPDYLQPRDFHVHGVAHVMLTILLTAALDTP